MSTNNLSALQKQHSAILNGSGTKADKARLLFAAGVTQKARISELLGGYSVGAIANALAVKGQPTAPESDTKTEQVSFKRGDLVEGINGDTFQITAIKDGFAYGLTEQNKSVRQRLDRIAPLTERAVAAFNRTPVKRIKRLPKYSAGDYVEASGPVGRASYLIKKSYYDTSSKEIVYTAFDEDYGDFVMRESEIIKMGSESQKPTRSYTIKITQQEPPGTATYSRPAQEQFTLKARSKKEACAAALKQAQPPRKGYKREVFINGDLMDEPTPRPAVNRSGNKKPSVASHQPEPPLPADLTAMQFVKLLYQGKNPAKLPHIARLRPLLVEMRESCDLGADSVYMVYGVLSEQQSLSPTPPITAQLTDIVRYLKKNGYADSNIFYLFAGYYGEEQAVRAFGYLTDGLFMQRGGQIVYFSEIG